MKILTSLLFITDKSINDVVLEKHVVPHLNLTVFVCLTIFLFPFFFTKLKLIFVVANETWFKFTAFQSSNNTRISGSQRNVYTRKILKSNQTTHEIDLTLNITQVKVFVLSGSKLEVILYRKDIEFWYSVLSWVCLNFFSILPSL